MLSRLDLRNYKGSIAEILPRPIVDGDGPVQAVREILEAVSKRGDAALVEFTKRFDQVDLAELTVSAEAVAAGARRVPPEVTEAITVAVANVRAYHEQQMPASIVHERDGIRIEGRHQAVLRAGCYVPGGRAVYPSTVIMTAVPAAVAGVEEIVMCVPPDASGSVPDVTLAAAVAAGVTRIHPVGGAQAIGAMAYGTESVEAVDVIVGPGNAYVAIAKREVAGMVGVPSAFAGPSEVVVIADETADPHLVAIDLMVQAEHGPDGLAWLVTWDESVVDRVIERIEALITVAPRAADIAKTLAHSGHAVLCDSTEQAMAVANMIAPEHLQLMTDNPQDLVPMVRNAGAVFCGPWSPASLGDYAAGPSHVLPTNGTARFASALTVGDFLKDIHVVTATKRGFDALAPYVEVLAEAEGLSTHAESIRARSRLRQS